MKPHLLLVAATLLLTAPLVSAQAGTPAQAAAPAASIAPMKVGGDVLPPKLIHSVEPKYPHPIFHKPQPSLVLVGLTVETNGSPEDIHIIKSGGNEFDKAAMNAVRKYRFEPATFHNKPVPVIITVEVQFKVF